MKLKSGVHLTDLTPQMVLAGVYKIYHIHSENSYIGSAINLYGRWRSHRSQLQRGIHYNSRLQNAWNKYGAAAFTFKPLLICAKADLLTYEQLCLGAFKPAYNVCTTAGNSLGTKRSQESRERMAAAHRGRKLSPEHRASQSIGKLGNKNGFGYKHTQESRAQMSARRIGNKYALGFKHTPEWLLKKSTEMLGNTHGRGGKGRKLSMEHRIKISVAHRASRGNVLL